MYPEEHKDLQGKGFLSENTIRALLCRCAKRDARKRKEKVNSTYLDPPFLNHYEKQPFEARQILAGTAPPATK